MGIMDKVSKTFGLGGDGNEAGTDSIQEELQAPNFEKKETPVAPPPPPPSGYVGHNVVDFNAAMASRESSMSAPRNTLVKSKITTVRPTSFDDAQTVANCLRDRVPVIINFENTNTEDAKRIIDFISGTTYAIHGVIRKVSQNVFVCAPSNVTVTYTEEDTKKTGSDFSWLSK